MKEIIKISIISCAVGITVGVLGLFYQSYINNKQSGEWLDKYEECNEECNIVEKSRDDIVRIITYCERHHRNTITYENH